MPTQGERQGYLFRPTTRDSVNLARYDEQADLWYKAFKNAERKNKPTDYRSTFNTIGLLISLFVSLLVLIVLSLIQLIKWLRK